MDTINSDIRKDNMLPRDHFQHYIQSFSPDPKKSQVITIASGDTVVLDVSKWILIRYKTLDGSKLKNFYDDNTAYWVSSSGGMAINLFNSITYKNENAAAVTLLVEGL